MGLHHGRGEVEAFDKQPDLVVDAKRQGTVQADFAVAARPGRRRRKKGMGRFAVVFALEEAEKTGLGIVVFFVKTVYVGGNPADHPAAPPGQIVFGLAELEKRSLVPVQEFPLHGHRGRHPKGVVAVDFPGETDKGVHIGRRLATGSMESVASVMGSGCPYFPGWMVICPFRPSLSSRSGLGRVSSIS